MPAGFSLPLDRTTVIARDADGQPIVFAAAGDVGGVRRLVLFSMADAGQRAVSVAHRRPGARHRRRRADLGIRADLDSCRRDGALGASADRRRRRRPVSQTPASDGRWLWAAVLALLAVEWRDAAAAPSRFPPPQVVHERVA